MNHVLHSEYNRPFDQQPKNSPWIPVALSPHQSRTFMPVHPRPPLPVSSNIPSQRTTPVPQFEHRLADQLHTAGNTLTSQVAGAAKRHKTASQIEPQGSPGDVFCTGALFSRRGERMRPCDQEAKSSRSSTRADTTASSMIPAADFVPGTCGDVGPTCLGCVARNCHGLEARMGQGC